ncbi:MAG: hypothetical protein U9Q07_01750 [Planctomycetota bacterium]|nr:hypothetical protein [Planctomycetota bacterium]
MAKAAVWNERAREAESWEVYALAKAAGNEEVAVKAEANATWADVALTEAAAKVREAERAAELAWVEVAKVVWAQG